MAFRIDGSDQSKRKMHIKYRFQALLSSFLAENDLANCNRSVFPRSMSLWRSSLRRRLSIVFATKLLNTASRLETSPEKWASKVADLKVWLSSVTSHGRFQC